MKFDYDAFGQRIAKHIYSIGTTPFWEKSIYYVRDAQGNIMATYEHKNVSGGVSYKVNERPMYGSSRIGVDVTPAEFLLIDGVEPPKDGLVPPGSPPPPPPPPPTTQTVTPDALGNKLYELNNHLGNVISVVSGAKFPVGTAGNPILSYNARIVSYNDYLPFGSTMTGRTFSSEKYRYGFQNQEKDDELKGTGNSVNFNFRMHDPRLGRFFAVDPLASGYPYNSTYAFSENDVMRAIELEGLEKYVVHQRPQKDGTMLVSVSAVEVKGEVQENNIPKRHEFLVYRLQHNADGTSTNLSSNELSSAESKIYESKSAVKKANPQFTVKETGELGTSFSEEGGVLMEASGRVGTPKAAIKKAPALITDPQSIGNNVLYTDGNLTPDANGILKNFAKQINGNAKSIGGVTINVNIGETSATPTNFSDNGYQNLKQGLVKLGVSESLIKPGDIGPKQMNERDTPTNASIVIDKK